MRAAVAPFRRFLAIEDEDPHLPLRALERVSRKVALADELLLRGRWCEAKALLASIDLSVLPISARDDVIRKHAYAAARAAERPP